jgi:hypothetical protein
MRLASRTLIASGGLLVAAVAATATIDSIEVDKKKGIYSLHAETFLDATPEAIFDVLIDYDRFGRISGAYKEYGYLDPLPDGTPVVFTRMEGCLLGFCKSMTRVERLEAATPAHIKTVTMPEHSDFKRSSSQFFMEEEGGGTRMTYMLEMEPDFFVPPLIGPWLLKRTLLRGGGRAVARIERLAQRLEAEWQQGL